MEDGKDKRLQRINPEKFKKTKTKIEQKLVHEVLD